MDDGRRGDGVIRQRRNSVSLVGALLALAVITTPVAARDQLLKGSVTPRSGTTTTLFVFSVTYQGKNPALGVTAQLAPGGPIIPLTPLGSRTDGQWVASRTLPAGTFTVTFVAKTANHPVTLKLPYTVNVTGLPTPT